MLGTSQRAGDGRVASESLNMKDSGTPLLANAKWRYVILVPSFPTPESQKEIVEVPTGG